ncbi:MAG: ATP-binding cassette domain-containing protein [Candidatus Thorarchaeota archaeon]
MSIVNLQNVTYNIKTSNGKTKTILQNVNLTVLEGEFQVIVGPSGSGKTTLLQIIATILNPTSGKRIIFGEETNEINKDYYKTREQIGYLHQTPFFPEYISVKEYLELQGSLSGQGLATLEAKIYQVLNDLQLGDIEKKDFIELSGGEKQRIALAAILIKKDLKLLLLDEPTGSLDIENSEKIWMLIKELTKQNLAIIAVTHDENIKNKADKSHLLDFGTII